MKDNTKKILKLMQELKREVDSYIDFVTSCNACAATDRLVEGAVEKAMQIKELHEEQFKEEE